MLQVRRTALLLALLAPLYLGLAGRSTLLGAPLPPGEREVRQRSSLHATAFATLDGVAAQMGLACAASEVFVWDGDGMNQTAAWLEAASIDAGTIYREIHRDFDTIVFRVFLDAGERLGMWVRLDGVALLAVCAI